MRVLEKETTTTYSMGKKNKHKLRKTKENEVSDSSEDVSGRGCFHVNKAVNFSAMKKGLNKNDYGECQSCARESTFKKGDKSLIEQLEGATSSDFIEEVEPTLWVCLQCGHQGCGRTSPEKHALKHYETPRSSQHNVVINITNWMAWCYDCDDEIHVEKHKKVSECMEHLKKTASIMAVPDTSQGKNSAVGGPSSSDAGINKGRPQSGKGAALIQLQKVKGLSNLGNTCFFNAVLQNLSQTYSLENLLGERKKGHPLKLQGHVYIDGESCSSSDEGDDNYVPKDMPSIEINITDPGPLTQALVVFLHEMNYTTKSSIMSPSALFGQVCKKAPRFKGMQQQDSHELLRYLMDNMKTEEIKRGQSGILKHFKLTENSNPKKVDEDTKVKVKAYGSEIKHTFVECLFGGQLISTVVCEECKYISQILEPFLDLSLPVTEEKPQRPNQTHGGRKKESVTEMKEDQPLEGATVKDDKMSKYQTKKAKKKQKRETKKQPKVSAADGGEKEGADCEGEKEETEDKEEEEGKLEDGQERYDDSDADVEDNLESDTSRCYNKNNSDTVFSSKEESLKQETSLETDTDNVRLGPQISINNLRVETRIENHPSTCSQSCDSSHLNGPINEVVTNGCMNGGENVSVSYTLLPNGFITLTDSKISINNSSANLPIDKDTHITQNSVNGYSDSTSCNSIDVKLDLNTCNNTVVDKLNSINDTSSQKKLPEETNKQLANGFCENGVSVANKNETTLPKSTLVSMSASSTSKDSAEDAMTEVTSGVSTLSLGDVSITSISSDLSKVTLNGNDETCCNGREADVLVASQTTDNVAVGVEAVGVKTEEVSEMNGKCDNHVDVKTAVDGEVQEEGQRDVGHLKSGCVNGYQAGGRHHKWKELQKEGQRRSVNTLMDRYHPISGECSIESCLHQFTAAELLTGNNKFGCKNCTKLKYKNHPNKEKKEMVYSNANKQYLIFQPPAVLTLHLKRFEQVGFSSRKVNRHVDFPFVLDISPYCSTLTQGIKHGQKKILYSLYGVVEHSGRLSSGHYTAYVKVRPNIDTLNNFLNKHNVTLPEYLHKYAQVAMNGKQKEAEGHDEVNPEGLVPPGRWYHISDSRVNEVTEASVERAQAYLLFYERIY